MGGLEPRRLHASTATTSRASARSSASRARPTWATLTRAVHAADGGPLTKDDPAFLLHQKAEDGNGKLDRGLAPHLGVPDDFADWHWADPAQPGARRPVRDRALPVVVAPDRRRDRLAAQRLLAGDLVGGDRRRRAPQAALVRAARRVRRRACSPCSRATAARCSPSSTRPRVIWQGVVRLSRQRLDGTVLAEEDLALAVGAWSVGHVRRCRRRSRRPTTRRTRCSSCASAALQTVHTWVEDVDLALDPAPLRATVTPVQDGYRVDVTATSLARDVTRARRPRSTPTRSSTPPSSTSRPASTASFHVRTRGTFEPADLTRAPVLRSANDVVVPARRRPVTSPSRPA